MKAICVDDEARTLRYTVDRCRELAQMDTVEGFTHAREAVEWLKDHPIDIAFQDIDMPEMDGITLAARIKEMYPNTAIVFLTAYRAPLKTLITGGRLNFSHLRLAKTLTARQAACTFCKTNLTKIHLAGRRDSF